MVEVTTENLIEESFRGRELAIRGRLCSSAVPILNQSLALYKAERDRPATLDAIRDTNLTSELSILTYRLLPSLNGATKMLSLRD